MHGRLTQEIAGRLRELKRREGALLFDCGDALDAPNYLPLPRKPDIVAAMNSAGYDAMALGNREYGWRRSTTARKLSGLVFPVLSANMVTGDGYPQVVRASVSLTTDGLTVGVFGISPNMAPAGSLAQRTSDVQFIAAERAARQALARLSQENDIVIGLLHWGTNMEEQMQLIQRLEGLDLALAGHWHVETGSLTFIGDIAVSRCGCRGREAAVLRRQSDGRWEQELVSLR